MEARTVAVIPAFNEARTIANVVQAALTAETVDGVVVVNDGSHDETTAVAWNAFEQAAERVPDKPFRLIEHMHNQGKAEAMESGYHCAKALGAKCLVFLDADLRSLDSEHINTLDRPVLDEKASMTIGILERTRLQKTILKHWGALSGQRTIPVTAWEQLPDIGRHGFNVEAALNSLYRQQGWHRAIQRVELHGVTHVGKREKEPTLLKAAGAYLETYGAAMLSYCRMELRRFKQSEITHC